MKRRAGLVAAALALFGCEPALPSSSPSPVIVEPISSPVLATVDAGAPAPPARDPLAEQADKKVRSMIARVAKARGLPILHDVPSKILNRDQIVARIREHVAREIPPDAVKHEGDVLAALELVPADYDFVEGTFKLLQGRIAGFYEPADKTMYMADDLTDEEANETLAHELEHALQDQTYPLDPLIRFKAGDGDRTAAAHAVIEGDAMSAMFDVVAGSAFNVSPTTLRGLLALSNAASGTSDTTPHFLQASLVAPYADGFAFVQQRRSAGGWRSVDAAWHTLPTTTEQLMHADKYVAHEPAITVAVPPVDALGAGFHAILDDVVGEQGMQLMLEEWTNVSAAATAAAGWGGDRYVVARRDDASAGHPIAVGWHMVFDTPEDAKEMADVLTKRFGTRCRERAALGPIVWQRKGTAIALAAGPFERQGQKPVSAGTCPVAVRWAKDMLAR